MLEKLYDSENFYIFAKLLLKSFVGPSASEEGRHGRSFLRAKD